jgi:L-alanine-DL-glutamate epimerase-like enolase superfamily enzyme
MLKVRFRKISTPFHHAFTTNHETKTHQEALLVAIEHNGLRGIGEAPIISYYPQTMETMISDLQAKAQMIEQYAFTEPERFWHFCHHLYPNNPFLVCALDLAYWDLYTQVEKQTISEIVTGKTAKEIPTFFTLGQDSFENMLAKMESQPWPCYKVKLTDASSIDVLRQLKEHTQSKFVVDANAAWDLSIAQQLIPELIKLDVLLIEQPLAKDNWSDMKILKDQFQIPFYADESFQTQKDLEKCSSCFDGINIKLTKCSGLTPAIQIIKQAKEMSLQTMLGCMNETELGIYPAVQIGNRVDYCDLDGPLLLDAPLKKMKYADGNIILA